MALKICYSYLKAWKMTSSSVEPVVAAVDGALAVDALPCVDGSGEAVEDSSCDEAAEAWLVDRDLSCDDVAAAPYRMADCDEASASSDTCDEEVVADNVMHPCSSHHRIPEEAALLKNCSCPFPNFSKILSLQLSELEIKKCTTEKSF
jgi:hypothetical protein